MRMYQIPLFIVMLVVALWAWQSRAVSQSANNPTTAPSQAIVPAGEPVEKIEKSDAEWKTLLTPEQFYILRKKGTERPFSDPMSKDPKPGTYVCAACELTLFTSDHKFDSGTGWPSYFQPIAQSHVTVKTDADGHREEVLCARCGGHLGHVFDDGPKPTGLRYCINGAAMKKVAAK